MFYGAPWQLVAGGIYSLLLVVAGVWDARTRRIPNRLTWSIALLGLVYSAVGEPVLPGTLRAIGGIGVGLICWVPFYAMGWLGAGDVKLFASAASWLGPQRALEAAVVAAVAGAILAVAWMLWAYGWRRAVTTLSIAAAAPSSLAAAPRVAARRTLPYGVALAIGALVASWMPGLFLG